MDRLMDLLTVREVRDNLYRLIDEVAEHHKPILISGKRNNAILISKEDWDSIQETIYLSSIPGMADSIRAAAAEPLEECVAVEDLDW
jgi:antitoxin YefM